MGKVTVLQAACVCSVVSSGNEKVIFLCYRNAPENVLLFESLEKALEVLSTPPYDVSIEHVYITGGYGVYKVRHLLFGITLMM